MGVGGWGAVQLALSHRHGTPSRYSASLNHPQLTSTPSSVYPLHQGWTYLTNRVQKAAKEHMGKIAFTGKIPYGNSQE